MNSRWKKFAPLFVGMGLLALLGSNRASAYKLAPGITGGRVTVVAVNSPAQRVGLEPGDVIVGINNQPIRSYDDYVRLMASGPKVTLLIRDVRTGKYNSSDAYPQNGKLGIRMVMTTVPEVVLPDIQKK